MSMTVKELIEALASADPEAQVILQRDGEGNGFSPLEGADLGAVYKPDSTWSGTVYDTKWSAEDAAMDPDEWETLKAKPRCVVLYPVN